MSAAAKVYVAGHRGLLGSAFVRRLSRDPRYLLVTRTHAELELRDACAVERFFTEERPDFVVLAAGRAGGIGLNVSAPATLLEDNLAIQLHVLSAARRAAARRVLFFGSSCMYPRAVEGAMREDLLFTAAPEPTSLAYATAKLAGVQQCLAYNRQDGGQRFVPLIPNNVYGPHDNFDPSSGHVLAALVARLHAARAQGDDALTLWGSGRPLREFVHADDVAAFGVGCLEADLASTTLPLNVGSGEEVSIRALATLVASAVGFTGTLAWDEGRPDGAPRKLLDSTRARSLGLSPAVSLAKGIADTYTWFVEHRVTAGV